jgi:hypothetical protein
LGIQEVGLPQPAPSQLLLLLLLLPPPLLLLLLLTFYQVVYGQAHTEVKFTLEGVAPAQCVAAFCSVTPAQTSRTPTRRSATPPINSCACCSFAAAACARHGIAMDVALTVQRVCCCCCC